MQFRHADPTRRIPTYLQAHTVENLVWQLKLTAVLIAGYVVYETVKDRRNQKKLEAQYN
jgi:hypothetical protein